eukprot:CAMPEP_0197875416 /NCGR_PEP_ID=MMETSP1439-20131203/4666_1 /TAXON_ID=66791 /ORGANISM="Gonyaulax spinifera, Strain CCMP409" /LENGTH=303 /DNA_ID=CAMNT_0043494615 /DNA_START=103 /DNA_END=1014 /DNA_ORIENTATION=+
MPSWLKSAAIAASAFSTAPAVRVHAKKNLTCADEKWATGTGAAAGIGAALGAITFPPACPITTAVAAGIGAGAAYGDMRLKCIEYTKGTVGMLMDDFDLDTYISKPWYSQMQNPQKYQPKDSLNCTSAQYYRNTSNGEFDLDVRNMGLVGDNYSYQSIGGTFEASDTKGFLCAKQLYKNRIFVAPCSLAKTLAGMIPPKAITVKAQVDEMVGNYWVIHHNETAGEAIIVGGQPDSPDPKCTKKCGFVNHMNEGMWIFTRQRNPDPAQVARLKTMMEDHFSLDTSRLLPVPQGNCSYVDALISK